MKNYTHTHSCDIVVGQTNPSSFMKEAGKQASKEQQFVFTVHDFSKQKRTIINIKNENALIEAQNEIWWNLSPNPTRPFCSLLFWMKKIIEWELKTLWACYPKWIRKMKMILSNLHDLCIICYEDWVSWDKIVEEKGSILMKKEKLSSVKIMNLNLSKIIFYKLTF